MTCSNNNLVLTGRSDGTFLVTFFPQLLLTRISGPDGPLILAVGWWLRTDTPTHCFIYIDDCILQSKSKHAFINNCSSFTQMPMSKLKQRKSINQIQAFFIPFHLIIKNSIQMAQSVVSSLRILLLSR